MGWHDAVHKERWPPTDCLEIAVSILGTGSSRRRTLACNAKAVGFEPRLAAKRLSHRFKSVHGFGFGVRNATMLAFPTTAALTAAGNVTAIVRSAGAAASGTSRIGQKGPLLGPETSQRLRAVANSKLSGCPQSTTPSAFRVSHSVRAARPTSACASAISASSFTVSRASGIRWGLISRKAASR